MSIGELLPEDLIPNKPGSNESGYSRVRTLVGWLVLVLIMFGVGAFVYRIWSYSKAIESGKMVNPPTFDFESTRLGPSFISSNTANRSILEIKGRPVDGAEENVAEAVVVVFEDFQCPFCKQEAPILRRIMSKYGDRVRFIYRHYPIDSLHPEAVQAAEASECAHEQGKFWQFHDKIYFSSDRLSTDTLLRYAEQVGADQVQFERCLSERRYQEIVESDIADAKKAGVVGTPTFYFDGQRIEGAIPENIFEEIFQRLLQ